MKEKIIQLLLKYIPWAAKKIWPYLKNSILRNTPPEIIAFRNEAANNNLLVFIHGFSGDAATTFGNIPEYLKADEKLKGWDIFSVGYSTDPMPNIGIGIWAASPDITKLSAFLITQLTNAFKKYNSIAIVAHSMGGLVVQRALVDLDEQNRNRIRYVFLYGTPSNGLVKARIMRWWNSQLKDMGKDGTFITGLRKQWSQLFTSKYPFTFKVVAGTDDEFVPVASSQSCFDKEYCEVVSGNHLSIVKPDSIYHAGYQLLLTTLTNTKFIDDHADTAAVNLMLGKYNEVVNALYPSANNIDSNGTTKLAFALEGLGRKQEAQTVLKNYLSRKKDTDILGMMGGRYKRDYLDTSIAEDAENAWAYYSEALDLSRQIAGNDELKNKQVFYHAINLAFLSLVYKNNYTDMGNYAAEAATAAANSPDDTWKFATLAEAAVYKRDLETAKINYTKASKMADLRAKDSIFTNAYMAYTRLYNTEEDSDDFIKFLRQTFLN